MNNVHNTKPCPHCGDRIVQSACYCKPCRASYIRAKRLLGQQNYDNNKAVKERRKGAKEQAVEALGGCCNRCGWRAANAAQLAVFQFHHHKRDRTWKTMGFGVRSADSISAELKKCELLCNRCHVLEHCEDPHNKPGRPRKPIDERTQQWVDKLRNRKP